MTTPLAYIDTKHIDLDRVQDRLIFACDQYTGILRKQHVHYAAKLDALSPLKVLSRGYSVVQNAEGEHIKEIGQVEIGDMLHVTLTDGKIGCRVEHKVIENE